LPLARDGDELPHPIEVWMAGGVAHAKGPSGGADERGFVRESIAQARIRIFSAAGLPTFQPDLSCRFRSACDDEPSAATAPHAERLRCIWHGRRVQMRKKNVACRFARYGFSIDLAWGKSKTPEKIPDAAGPQACAVALRPAPAAMRAAKVIRICLRGGCARTKNVGMWNVGQNWK
jgi:hypothetical protein